MVACASSGSQAPIEEPIPATTTPGPAAAAAAEPAAAEPAAAEPAVEKPPVEDASAQPAAEPVAPAAVPPAKVEVAAQPPKAQAKTTTLAKPAAKPLLVKMIGTSGGNGQGLVADVWGAAGDELSMHVASAKGGLDAQAAQRVMDMARPNFQRCVDKTPAHQTLSLELAFRIGPKGNTSAVSAKNATKKRPKPGAKKTIRPSAKNTTKAVATCVAKLVRNLQFEQSTKATKVAATISFRRSGELFGMGGLGLSGIGKGGGGTGHGTIGLGSIGTIGHGSGSGSGYGRGSGNAFGARPQSPLVRVGNAVATGDLDKNIIRRIIRRKLPRIRFCYEKVLIKKPSLSGTVVVNFEISPEGRVSKAEAKGLDTAVSDCVAKTLLTTRFPNPRNGGKVTVRYPFTFMPSK